LIFSPSCGSPRIPVWNNYLPFYFPARCRSWDANFLDKRGFDISWNSWPYSMDGNSAEFLKYGNDRLPDDAFEGCHLLKKRCLINT